MTMKKLSCSLTLEPTPCPSSERGRRQLKKHTTFLVCRNLTVNAIFFRFLIGALKYLNIPVLLHTTMDTTGNPR